MNQAGNGHGHRRHPKRPASIAELADKALEHGWDDGRDLKHYLRMAEKYRKEGKDFAKQGDLESAFVLLAKAATLVLEKLPTHRDYQTLLNPAQRNNLALNGQDILDHLSELKPILVDRFDKWLKAHPDGLDHDQTPEPPKSAALQQDDARAQAQAQAQAQANAARFQEEERMRASQRDQQRRVQEEAALWRQQREEIIRRGDAETKERQKAAAVAAARQAANPGSYGSQHTAVVHIPPPPAAVRHQQQQDEFRRREEEINRRKRRQEQDAIAQRQQAADDAARAMRQTIPTAVTPAGVPVAPLYPQTTPTPNSARSYQNYPVSHPSSVVPPAPYSAPAYSTTPSHSEGPSIMPLENPLRYEGDSTDSESVHHDFHRRISKQRHHTASPRAPVPNSAAIPPITTTSPPPQLRIDYPRLMSPHQQKQGYYPSLNSMFMPEPSNNATPSLLFDSNGLYPQNMLPSHAQPYNQSRPPLPPPPPNQNQYPNYPGPTRPPPPVPTAPPTATQPQPSEPDRISRERSREPGSGRPPLKQVNFPRECLPRFLAIAKANTMNNKETCGLLLGKDKGHKYVVTTLLIPKQHSTSDTCTMDEEQLVLEFTEERSLITLGWIHTHPSQSCFMSSVDLHTHSGFQRMLPESFAVVCAPNSRPNDY
ncbi:hypothetical protein CC1G_07493 [Coprinopsis cinerea okayama7|uniref:MPN domain-containing protein n=1 Tax=Coprinopsis cinerea (strain Okayama-7 / 130 / ATCC MYA-4618 / FGSC 9003) TaxID=240176 RepID=A8P113_COPC7|nr:hypothetical protein CC1G_07493 [Coprinopsis cinerea okayama7\|eukprot:XP_001838003.2 hypothetical protein CC1G_07493 [Coprinopsis cinerea okayama7\